VVLQQVFIGVRGSALGNSSFLHVEQVKCIVHPFNAIDVVGRYACLRAAELPSGSIIYVGSTATGSRNAGWKVQVVVADGRDVVSRLGRIQPALHVSVHIVRIVGRAG